MIPSELPFILTISLTSLLNAYTIAKGRYTRYIHTPRFAVIKILSVWLGVFFIYMYIWSSPVTGGFDNTISNLILFSFVLNIVEATVLSGLLFNENKVHALLVIMGTFLIYNVIAGSYSVQVPEGGTRIQTDFPDWLIWAYTSWNTVFVFLITSVKKLAVLNIVVSLGIPLLIHYFTEYDWLQSRAVILLLYTSFI